MVNWNESVVYSLADVPYYLGCSVSGEGTDTVTLSNVTSCMNGWRIQAVYSGSGGPVYTDMAYIYVSSGNSCSGSRDQWYLHPISNGIPDYMKSWTYSYDSSTGCIYYDESIMQPTNSYPYGSAPGMTESYYQTQLINDYYSAVYGNVIPIYYLA